MRSTYLFRLWGTEILFPSSVVLIGSPPSFATKGSSSSPLKSFLISLKKASEDCLKKIYSTEIGSHDGLEV